jgi:hypothetical protein
MVATISVELERDCKVKDAAASLVTIAQNTGAGVKAKLSNTSIWASPSYTIEDVIKLYLAQRRPHDTRSVKQLMDE